MKCEICEEDSNLVLILPIVQASSNLNTMACHGCAEKTDVYCLKHDKIHVGFTDNTSFCPDCVTVVMERHAGEALEIYTNILASIGTIAAHNLRAWAIQGGRINDEIAPVFLLRELVKFSLRHKRTIASIVEDLIAAKSIAHILPFCKRRMCV